MASLPWQWQVPLAASSSAAQSKLRRQPAQSSASRFRTNLARRAAGDSRAALWLGPDEWLLLAPPGQAQSLIASIAEKLAGIPHALVEISDRNQGLLLDGPGSEDVLSAGCPLDLDIASFPVDACTRTLFGKAEIVLWRTSPQSFRLEVARSFLPYVIGLLDLAVRDAATMARR